MPRSQMLNVEEVKEYNRRTGNTGPLRPGEHRAYQGPYPTVLAERNHWTAVQETADIEPPELPGGPIPDVPPVTLYPIEHNPPASGGSGSFSVTVTGPGASGTWIVDPEAEATWLHISSPPAHEPQATAGGSVVYSVDPNTGAARVAHIYVNGKTFTVNQAAPSD